VDIALAPRHAFLFRSIQMQSKPIPIPIFASFSGAGGVERMLLNLMQGFIDAGHTVDLLLAGARGPHVHQIPAQVHRIDLGTRHTLTAVWALAAYLRRTRPPAILVAKDRAGRAAVIARGLAVVDTQILLRLGTTLSAAMAERSALARFLRYQPIRWLYPKIDHIIAVSDGVAEDTARIARYPRERIRVIRNPVITTRFLTQATEPCAHPWFSSLARACHPVIVGAGRLERQKDFPSLIRAFAQLRAQRPCRLVILGDGRERAALQALAQTLGIAESVDLPGFKHNLASYLANADLFVLSSLWEGSPNVLTEAMALGTPVVATDCPSGPREILDEGRHGGLTPVADSTELGRAMATALDAPAKVVQLKGAIDAYRQDYSVQRYLELIERGRS
jgi:glycosyltransferase involved in cell wall biosynthesis